MMKSKARKRMVVISLMERISMKLKLRTRKEMKMMKSEVRDWNTTVR